MKLKRLGMQGYKTFASRTNFEFDEGITAIVGPNGCGKSNIADAIRWVLGEQSYSTLRGKRTTDMIFAGSQQRARAGMAQAILTLDNSEGWLPIDYSEIEIGRRAHRSGDNEYLLNGQRVRLRDITDLLAKSGLAHRTYTIIGQGLVDQALSLRADERRMLFEEAAGVSHYKQRRAETLRRLEETTHNLERVQDIIAEIRPRLNTLRRQAKRARNYEQVAADLRYLLQIWYGYKWEQAKSRLRAARDESEAAQRNWGNARREQLQCQERLDGTQKDLYRLQHQQRELELRREDVRESLENARREVAVLSERKALLQRQLDEHADELPALQTQKAAAARELEQALSGLKSAQEDMEKQQAELRSFEAGFLEHQTKIDRWQQNVTNLQLDHEQTSDALAQAKGRAAQLSSQLRERLAEATDELDRSPTEEEVQALESQLTAERSRLTQIQTELDSEMRVRQRAEASLKEARSDKDVLVDELATLDKQIAGLESRLEILDRPDDGEAEFPVDLPNRGQLADALDIPNPFQKAIRAALSHWLLTWIVDDEQAIWKLRESVGEGRLLTIARDQIPDRQRPVAPRGRDVIGWADELVALDGADAEPIKLLLSRILVVGDAETAYEIAGSLAPGNVVASVDGVVVHRARLVEFGAESVNTAQLARSELRQKTSNDLAQMHSRRSSLARLIAESEKQRVALQTTLDQHIAEQNRLEDERRNYAATVAQAGSTHKLTLQSLQFYRSNAIRIRQSIVKLEERLAETKESIEEHEVSVVKLSMAIEEGQLRLEKLPVAESAEARKQLAQSVQSAKTILAGRQAVVDSRRTTLNQIGDQLRRREVRLEELRSRWKALELEPKEADMMQLQRQMESVRELLGPLDEQIVRCQRQVATLNDELSKLQRTGHESETRYTQARIELTQGETLIESLKERIRADLGLVSLSYDEDQPGQSPLPMAEVVEELPVVQHLPEDIEDSIQRYRGQLNRIGAVNPEAPAEYDETLARHDFLVQQIEDLTATKQRLREVIDDLDQLTSRAFVNTVEEVNGIFGEVFKRLFGGGSAQLALTDPDDLTITGVDIVARLPRRREQGLALLSGGERSLTAAALIFALLKVSPTPFCVLDEVDAMLDEANINRFREVLTELSERTQFIVITHNRGTVQVAESVYGVSMGADSVSQVISIKPEDYVHYRPG
ncbi:MAG: chromosome segregation protein SMC [Chloroflexota bacterium]|nr:MAG: chromosome segregation protein SMC [Chloroflexota bacterium]